MLALLLDLEVPGLQSEVFCLIISGLKKKMQRTLKEQVLFSSLGPTNPHSHSSHSHVFVHFLDPVHLESRHPNTAQSKKALWIMA